jgi:mono/diheme cytochrome c family protein
MQGRNMLWFAVVLISIAMLAGAQEQAQKVVKHVPVKPTSAASGEEMFNTYCAVCHGKDGKGNGPAAEALKVPPPDLTVLTKNNKGSYPSLKVSAVIRGEQAMPAHGSKDMPVWGSLFWKMSQGHESEVQQRIANLNKYVEGMQQK